MTVSRASHLRRLRNLLRQFPVVALVGARQVGKSTLARQVARRTPATVFDLEDPRDLARLQPPTLALEPLRGLVVLDEIHRMPGLFQVLRVLADRPRRPARFLVLGSAAPDLLRQGSETLAGRIAFFRLPGFTLEETGADPADRLWLRGGFPRSYLSGTDEESLRWRQAFVRTFLQRDLADLGIGLAPETMDRFWRMLAHYHGQVWNASELARSFGVTSKTVGGYLDALAGTYMVRRLQPWFENIAKRQVKAPKIYIADSGLLHCLLGIADQRDLRGHPKVGASWEGFALEQVLLRSGAEPEECYFWKLHTGAELDLLVVRGRRRLGFEFQLTDAPAVTPSMRSALDVLRLARLDVVHAGRDSFSLGQRIRALSLRRLWQDLEPLS